MNTRPDSRKMSFVSKVLLGTLLCLVVLLGALSYAVLGRGQTIESSSSRSAAFRQAQFTADVRTVTAAISYLLEPEPAELIESSAYSLSLKNASPALPAQCSTGDDADSGGFALIPKVTRTASRS